MSDQPEEDFSHHDHCAQCGHCRWPNHRDGHCDDCSCEGWVEPPMTRDEIIRQDLSFAAEVIREFLLMGVCPHGYDREDLHEFTQRLDLASLRGEGWQPIETAPKGADVILLYCPAEGVMPGYWDDLDWVSVETRSLSSGPMLATHWMPLPAPQRLKRASAAPPAMSEKGSR